MKPHYISKKDRQKCVEKLLNNANSPFRTLVTNIENKVSQLAVDVVDSYNLTLSLSNDERIKLIEDVIGNVHYELSYYFSDARN